MSICNNCPVRCGADRNSHRGYCLVQGLKIAKYYLHPFEEPCISFSKGSGTIFFCGCALRCVFCQNYEVSRNETGKEITVEELADIFRELEEMGADNINLVNPTQYVEQIIQAFEIYRPNIPVVYNSHGYESVEALEKIDKYVDIYLPDCKFVSEKIASRYTTRPDYFTHAKSAIEFMAKKRASFSEEGKMLSGCIVRHLIMPLCTNDSLEVLNFFSTLPESTLFSVMSQYTPFGDIKNYKELQRKITPREYKKVVDYAEKIGISGRVFLQDDSSSDENFIPKWDF